MKNDTYNKPILRELDEVTLEEIDGGVGFIVVVGAAVAVFVAAGGVTVVAAATLVDAGAAVQLLFAQNVYAATNTVTTPNGC